MSILAITIVTSFLLLTASLSVHQKQYLSRMVKTSLEVAINRAVEIEYVKMGGNMQQFTERMRHEMSTAIEEVESHMLRHNIKS